MGGCRVSVYDKYANLQVYLPFLFPRKRAARMETKSGENQPTAMEVESVEEKEEEEVDPNLWVSATSSFYSSLLCVC